MRRIIGGAASLPSRRNSSSSSCRGNSQGSPCGKIHRILSDDPVPEGEVVVGREVITSAARYIGPQETMEMGQPQLAGESVSFVELGVEQ